jgi:tetratricopeptide (TPR) repeat protein
VHIDRADFALFLLQRTRATKYDPWLMAPEISIALVANRPSKMVGLARKEIKREIWSPRNRSELVGALGTVFLETGSTAQARQMFRISLDDPTENAIAQAQWAVERTSGLEVPERYLKLPTAYEARALCYRTIGRWDLVIDNCWNWAEYEPTSSRSMLMGSYAASIAFEDGPMIVEFAERGLEAEPNNPFLINNKTVGLAYKGDIKEAMDTLGRLVIEQAPDLAQPALYATMGLLYFRSGDPENGRVFYEKAITHPYSQKDPKVKALAYWHLVREEAHAKTKEFPQALSLAEKATKKMKLPEIDAIRAHLPTHK